MIRTNPIIEGDVMQLSQVEGVVGNAVGMFISQEYLFVEIYKEDTLKQSRSRLCNVLFYKIIGHVEWGKSKWIGKATNKHNNK